MVWHACCLHRPQKTFFGPLLLILREALMHLTASEVERGSQDVRAVGEKPLTCREMGCVWEFYLLGDDK
jgi:hypothetical protein